MQVDAHHFVHEEFWNSGHELFRSAPETFPVWFLADDIFDRSFLAAAKPLIFSIGSTRSPSGSKDETQSVPVWIGLRASGLILQKRWM
jgi:hypothetical protein